MLFGKYDLKQRVAAEQKISGKRTASFHGAKSARANAPQ
jgi:hypothetical protein